MYKEKIECNADETVSRPVRLHERGIALAAPLTRLREAGLKCFGCSPPVQQVAIQLTSDVHWRLREMTPSDDVTKTCSMTTDEARFDGLHMAEQV